MAGDNKFWNNILYKICTFLLIFIILTNFPKLVSKEIKISSNSDIVQLSENKWKQILKGEWMIEFFAPWCPACQHLQSIWEQLASNSTNLNIHVAQVDVTSNPGLSGRFLVTALPTIYHVKDGIFRLYKGSRLLKELVNFIEEKHWMEIESISTWRSPDSLQMVVVSWFFRLSMLLKRVHTILIQDYNFPYWFSYLLFGLMTVLIGAFIGLVMVCCMDWLYPTHVEPSMAWKASLQNLENKKKKNVINDEDEIRLSNDDDIKLSNEEEEEIVQKIGKGGIREKSE